MCAPAHVLMRLYPIDKSLVCLQSERRTSMLELHIYLSKFLFDILYAHKIVLVRALCQYHRTIDGSNNISMMNYPSNMESER